jgi:hypothetical protein
LADKEECEEKETIVVAPNFDQDIPVNEQCLDPHVFRVAQVSNLVLRLLFACSRKSYKASKFNQNHV